VISKLTITPCNLDEKGNVTGPDTSKTYTARINPSNYARNFDITYNNTRAMGTPTMQPKFNTSGEKNIQFDIVIDGTGVVPPTSPSSTAVDIDTQLDDLKKVIFTLDGTEHQPNTVMLAWGSFKFVGKLNSMKVEYTLFKPSGIPLRAKINLNFIQYVGPKETASEANMSSPDLTHAIEFKAGDTLPLLCFRVYKDSAYYLEVAKINGINNFRDIKPGTRLNFPPLR
jgi:hypothetical protein